MKKFKLKKDEEIIFKWHFPKGTLRTDMTKKEIINFLTSEAIKALVSYLPDNKRIRNEFTKIFEDDDQSIQIISEADDIIYLTLNKCAQ